MVVVVGAAVLVVVEVAGVEVVVVARVVVEVLGGVEVVVGTLGAIDVVDGAVVDVEVVDCVVVDGVVVDGVVVDVDDVVDGPVPPCGLKSPMSTRLFTGRARSKMMWPVQCAPSHCNFALSSLSNESFGSWALGSPAKRFATPDPLEPTNAPNGSTHT